MERTDFSGDTLWNVHESMRNDFALVDALICNFRNAVFGNLQNINNGEINLREAFALKIEGAKMLEHVAGECMQFMGGTG